MHTGCLEVDLTGTETSQDKDKGMANIIQLIEQMKWSILREMAARSLPAGAYTNQCEEC
jgi:hypothetical protein